MLYEWYINSSEIENRIKDFKLGIKAGRLCCRRFLANQFSGSFCTPPTACWMGRDGS